MSNLRSAEAHLLELRKIHSMLHAAMDALIKDLNANDAARILILLDDRLTSLINSADVEPQPRPAPAQNTETPRVEPAQVVPPAAEPTPRDEPTPQVRASEAPKPSSTMTVRPGTPATPPPKPAAAAPKTVDTPPSPAPAPVESSPPDIAEIPVTPIIAVPPAAAATAAESLTGRPAFPSFEDMIAGAARARIDSKPELKETVPPSETPKLPEAGQSKPAEVMAASAPDASATELKAAPDLVATPAAVAAVAAALAPSADSAPEPAPSDEPPAAVAEDPGEDAEWIEEDFEEGEDLALDGGPEGEGKPAPEPDAPKVGLAGRFLSKLRLPGLGRRRAEALPDEEPAAEEDFPDDDDTVAELADSEAVSPAFLANLRRLHGAAEHIAAGQLLAEAEERTGNRIELRTVADGLDLVVKGLPTALGTVRLSADDGHVLYHPRFGLDLPNREPNRADLELWTKAMGDLVVRVLEDIAARRKGRTTDTDGEPS